MNKYNKILSIIVPLVLLMAFLILPTASVSADSGIGVTPSVVVFQDVLPGSSSQKQLTIYNLNTDSRDILAKVTGTSAGWISFLPGDTISIAGKGSGTLTVVISLPKGTTPGTYDDDLLIVVKPTTQVISGGAGAEITPGAIVPIHITVGGTATVALNLISAEVSTAEVGQPLGITIVLENSGNVTVTPAVKVEILDEQQQSVIKTFEQDLEQINPAVRVEIPLSMASEGLQQETTYWAKITVTLYGTVIGELTSSFMIKVPFIVYPEADLLAIQVPAFVTIGQVVNVTAIVRNTGKNVIYARFQGSAAKGNIIADTFASPTISILPGATTNLSVASTPHIEGDFIVSGMVFYGDNEGGLYYFTPNKTALSLVSAPSGTATPSGPIATAEPIAPSAESGGSGNGWILIVGLIAGGVLLVLVLALLWRRQRKNASKKSA